MKLEMKLGLKLQFKLYDAVKDLRSMCEGIISEKMEQKRLGTKPTKEHYDIVDMMLDAEPKMDLQALVSNIFIFFLAGHETTGKSLLNYKILPTFSKTFENTYLDAVLICTNFSSFCFSLAVLLFG